VTYGHGACIGTLPRIEERPDRCKEQQMKLNRISRAGAAVFSSRERVALAQTLYFVPTGIWPIVHIRSFEWLTGAKVDRWLVKTVGGVVLAAGVGLGMATANRRLTPEIDVVAVGTAATLATIDIVYVHRRRISPIYLGDAALNLALIAGTVRTRMTGR
jgi:hypothetical protein